MHDLLLVKLVRIMYVSLKGLPHWNTHIMLVTLFSLAHSLVVATYPILKYKSPYEIIIIPFWISFNSLYTTELLDT